MRAHITNNIFEKVFNTESDWLKQNSGLYFIG